MEGAVKYWNSLPREVVEILSTHKIMNVKLSWLERCWNALHRNHLFMYVSLMN